MSESAFGMNLSFDETNAPQGIPWVLSLSSQAFPSFSISLSGAALR